jgi:hypothetical protein
MPDTMAQNVRVAYLHMKKEGATKMVAPLSCLTCSCHGWKPFPQRKSCVLTIFGS